MTTVMESIGQLESVFGDVVRDVAGVDYQPILQGIQQEIAEGEAAAFDGEREPGGPSWTPLATSTIKRKRSSRILFESGALQASLVALGEAGNISTTSSRELLFGSDVPYVTLLDNGTSRMPARPPVGVSEETLDKACNQIADETVRQLTASGSE